MISSRKSRSDWDVPMKRPGLIQRLLGASYTPTDGRQNFFRLWFASRGYRQILFGVPALVIATVFLFVTYAGAERRQTKVDWELSCRGGQSVPGWRYQGSGVVVAKGCVAESDRSDDTIQSCCDGGTKRKQATSERDHPRPGTGRLRRSCTRPSLASSRTVRCLRSNRPSAM